MANLTETSMWVDGIYQLETSDPVLGGPDGISNLQAEQLGNRTAWLKETIVATSNSVNAHIRAENPHTQYALITSPEFTGTPMAPTVVASDNSKKLATTQFVSRALDAVTTTVSTDLSGKMDKSKNGADIADKAKFLANLGLSVGTKAGTVAAGDDARIVNAISIKNTDIQLPGRLTGSPLASTGRVYANEAFLETDGNIYGTRWGGWLSSYIESRWNSANAWFDESPRGWHLDRATGMLMQWGHVKRTASSTAVNFYVAFPNHCACVFMTQTSAGGGSAANILAQNVTATGFNVYMASSERAAFWLAIGF